MITETRALTSGIVRCRRLDNVDSRRDTISLSFAHECQLAHEVRGTYKGESGELYWTWKRGRTIWVDDRRLSVHDRHIDQPTGIHLVGHSVRLREGDLLDDGRLGESSSRSFGSCVLDEKHLIRWWVPYHGFVEYWVAFGLSDKR